MIDVLLDALIDSAKVLAILVVVYFLIALLEPKLSSKLTVKSKLTPLIGVSLGLLPQCGFSVVATDLYQKRHVTMGTLLGVYLATSDEALPIFLANPDKVLMLLPLLGIKFVAGLLVGYTVDLIYTKSKADVIEHHDECEHAEEVHLGCCGHEIEKDRESCGHTPEEEKKETAKRRVKQYVLHPLIHSIKIFFYILAVNILFGILIYYVGEDRLSAFLSANKYATPALAVLVGLIPNCASSVVLSDLYIVGGLGFGATVGGLCANAGLGLMMLAKDRAAWKRNLVIVGILIFSSLVVGYLTSLAFSFN